MSKGALIKSVLLLICITALSYSFLLSITGNPPCSPDYQLLGTWNLGANISFPVMGGAGVSYIRNDTGWLYVIGGDLTGTGTFTGKNQRYNLNTNSWDTCANHISPRAYFGGARLGNFIYTVGGLKTSSQHSSDKHCYRYDINANTWMQITDITEPNTSGIAGNRCVGYQDSLIYSAGGFYQDSTIAMQNVYLYNIYSNTWRTATPLPAARCLGGFTAIGDTLVYVGGSTSYYSGNSNSLYRGLISQSNRSQITWTQGNIWSIDLRWRIGTAEPWAPKGVIVEDSNQCSIYSPGNNSWTWQPYLPYNVGETQSGSIYFSSSIMKFICAGGSNFTSIYPPNVVPYTQIYTDTGIVPPTFALPWCEGFSSASFPPTWWTLSPGATHWLRNANVSGFGLGVGAAYYRGHITAMSENMITPRFTAISSCDSLEFDYAYAPYPATPPYIQDSLIIMRSSNNGASWNLLARLGPSDLQTAPSIDSEFIPSASQWSMKRLYLPVGTNKINFFAKPLGGNDIYLDSICVQPCYVGIIKNEQKTPLVFSLDQNSPNPFNPSTKIKFQIPLSPLYERGVGGFVTLKIFDLLGREVASLIPPLWGGQEGLQPGTYEVEWDATNYPSGVYFYKLTTDSRKDG